MRTAKNFLNMKLLCILSEAYVCQGRNKAVLGAYAKGKIHWLMSFLKEKF